MIQLMNSKNEFEVCRNTGKQSGGKPGTDALETSRDQFPKTQQSRLVYRRPYEDHWGALHDPTTWWDELLKYYRHYETLQVSQACRRMAQPAHIGAMRLIRAEQRRHRQYAARLDGLEAQYLESTYRRKSWKRRQRKKSRLELVSSKEISNGA
jgi:hypothetical protein